MEVTVAAYGPSASEIFGPNYFEGPRFDSEGDGVPWSERKRVTLDVDPTETLATTIDRAAAEFGVTTSPGGPVRTGPPRRVSEEISGVAFYKESDDLAGGHPYPWLNLFTCVAAEGQLSWKWVMDAQYGDLVRAYERGLLPGDPQRPYLWPIIPQGGEVAFGSWPDLLEVAGVVLDALEATAAVYGTAEFVGAIKRRLQRLRTINHDALDGLNAGPVQVQELLTSRRASAEEIADYFRLAEEEASGLVHAFGLDVGEEGRTEARDTPDAKFERRFLNVAMHTSGGLRPSDDHLKTFVDARLDAIARGEDESVVTWSREWHESAMSPAEAGFGPEAEEQADGDEEEWVERSGRTGFRIVSVNTDDGIDAGEMEALLNESAKGGYEGMYMILDQPLKEGGRGHVFVLTRFVVDEG